MRNFLFALIGLVFAITFPAVAADIPSGKPAPSPPLVAPASSWTGLYFGVSGGYAFDSAPTINLEAYNSGAGTSFQPYAYASGASAVLNNRAFVFSPNIGSIIRRVAGCSALRLQPICRWAAMKNP